MRLDVLTFLLVAVAGAGCSQGRNGDAGESLRRGGSAGKSLTIDGSFDGSTLLYVSDDDRRVFLKRGEAAPVQVAEGERATLMRDGSVVVSDRPGMEYRLRRMKDGESQELFADSGTQDTQPCAVGDGVAFVRSLRSRPYSMGGTVQTDFVLMASALGGKPRCLSARPFFSMVLRPQCDDGKYVYFSGAPSAREAEGIYRVPLAGRGDPERIVKLGTLETVTVSPERGLIAFTDRTTPESGEVTYSVKTARMDGTGVRVVARIGAEQLVFTDHGRSLVLLEEPELDGRYDLEMIDLASGKTIKRVELPY